MLKIRWSCGCLIFNMGIPIPGNAFFIMRQVPESILSISLNSINMYTSMNIVSSQGTGRGYCWFKLPADVNITLPFFLYHVADIQVGCQYLAYEMPANDNHDRCTDIFFGQYQTHNSYPVWQLFHRLIKPWGVLFIWIRYIFTTFITDKYRHQPLQDKN